jgi:hypothetical protein
MFFRKLRDPHTESERRIIDLRIERLERELLALDRRHTQLLEYLGLAVMHVPAHTELRKKDVWVTDPLRQVDV